MGSEQIEVVIEFTKKDGTAFKAGEAWYNLPKGETMDFKLKGAKVKLEGVTKVKPGSFDIESYEVVTEAPAFNPAGSRPQGQSNKGGFGGKSYGGSDASRDARIVVQNALAHTTALVNSGKVKFEDFFAKAREIADFAMAYVPSSTAVKVSEPKAASTAKVSTKPVTKPVAKQVKQEEVVEEEIPYDDEVPY